MSNRLIGFTLSILIIISLSLAFGAKSVWANHRPACHRFQIDFKQGANLNRLGWYSRIACDGVMRYLGSNDYMQLFDWSIWRWKDATFPIGGSGEYFGDFASFTSQVGRGPIPPYLGINCRRMRIKYVSIWYDFSDPNIHPGEGLRFSNGWTNGECW